jgi:hypothetical protein
MYSGTAKRRPVSLLALIVLLALSFLAGAANGSGPSHAQEAPAIGPDTGFWCTPTGVLTSITLVGVTCNPGVGDLNTFLYPTTTSAESRQGNRFLAIANTAVVLHKNIWMFFDDSAAANPPGCAASNCRRLTSMMIQP